MNEIIIRFLQFLAEEHNYLVSIRKFLSEIPALITSGQITEFEFQNFLEKHELQTARFIFDKNQYRAEIAKSINTAAENINFKLLVKMGFREFESKGRKVLKISNEISRELVKISIFLRNFSKLQTELKRLNNFLIQKDYSPRGVESTYAPGRNFYGEA